MFSSCHRCVDVGRITMQAKLPHSFTVALSSWVVFLQKGYCSQTLNLINIKLKYDGVSLYVIKSSF